MKRDYEAALKAREGQSNDLTANQDRLCARAAIHLLTGDGAVFRDEIENGRTLVEAKWREQPDDPYTLTQMSWINLALQRNSEALKFVRHAAELMPPEKDDVEGPEVLAGLAEIEARAGNTEEAVRTLQRVLFLPAGMVVSIARLKLDPVWDPLRNDPAFQQLLAGPQRIGPNE